LTNLYYIKGDRIAKKLSKYCQKVNLSPVPFDIKNISQPFFLINGDNNHHHRTYKVIKSLGSFDGYFHIDHHDDLGLASVRKVQYDNFVYHLLKNSYKVVFVGQKYWKRETVFYNEKIDMLFRNNIEHYYPIDNIYFLSDVGEYIFIPISHFNELILKMPELVKSKNIEEIYILDEMNYKNVKSRTFTRRDLIHEPFAPDLYAGAIIKFKSFSLSDLDFNKVYISIDLDVLKIGLLHTPWTDDFSLYTISELLNEIRKIIKKYEVIGIDICGPDYLDIETLKNILFIIFKISSML